MPLLGSMWKIFFSKICLSKDYSSVGSPGSAQGSISISLSFGILNVHSEGTPPMFLRERVTLRGFDPYLIGILPKSQVKVVRFF